MIYFDNAATTYPKPEKVYKALDYANRNLAFNAGRGEYIQSAEAFNLIEETRTKIASMINRKSDEVVFTSSATESLNIIINGINIEYGDYIYISPFEHNAVIRPLYNLQKKINFHIEILPFDRTTWLPNLSKIENEFAINHPKAVFISHISNVTGYMTPFNEIFDLADKWNSINILDCAQSFGITFPEKITNVNYLVFAGHKALYASFGVAGFFKLKNDVLNIVKAGGTGSDSLNLEMPSIRPYRYESGSPNVVAIAGLNASIEWLKETDIKGKEENLYDYFLERLEKIENIVIYKPRNVKTFGILSINIDGYKSEDVASILNEEYDICVRAGYHCAPFIHDFIDSKSYYGTVRISFNYFNTINDIDLLLEAIKSL